MQLGSQRCCDAVMLSGAKHLCVVRLRLHQHRSEILRFAQDDISSVNAPASSLEGNL